ncbi:MAG: VWA domain-containing protein [Actinobacteria bacterium]|nr:VWA domain-containing protein [Actinomycetota bacterium]
MSESALVVFGRALRAEGLAVGSGRILEFCRAASLLPPGDLYWAGRATLVPRRDDIPVYDRVFDAFFGPPSPEPAPRPSVRVRLEPEVRALASPVELLREKSFARCTPDELAELARLMAHVRLAVPVRRTRRRRSAKRGAPDVRRTLRRSFRTSGEPFERAYKRRVERKRRVILVLDVSGSMAEYSRGLLLFAHAGLRSDPNWDVFCFGTRLTRLTRTLAVDDRDDALRRAAFEVFDWDGGTRIGESLKRLLDEHGHRGRARGAVVVICSDGLEVGDPEDLAEQMARLSRLAYRIVWLNPLQEDPAYEPLARGMQAALPHVDRFMSGHNLASLETLAEDLARL